MNPLLRSAASILLGWGIPAVIDATAPNPLDSFRTTHWTSEKGLPQNKVQCLLQSRDGYLWIGTHAGLARFDGVKYAVLDQSHIPGLAGDSVTHAVEAPEGSL